MEHTLLRAPRVAVKQLTWRNAKRRQGGFSLVELSLVTAIVLLIAIMAVPAINNYVIENRVPKVGEELLRFMLNMEMNATATQGFGYHQVSNQSLALYFGDSSLFDQVGAGESAALLHGLGKKGELRIQPVGQGEQYQLSLSNVHHAACPGIASVLQKAANGISVLPEGGTSVVLKGPQQSYSAVYAASVCARGDKNTFVFTAG